MNVPTPLRALAHRNFRLFFAGQSISLIGTWMQQLAMQWLVYRLSGSSFLLGAVGFAGQIPAFVLAPLAGVLSDRWSRHKAVLATQTLAMLQATVLAALSASGEIRVWQVIALSAFLGVVNGFDMPTRQSFLVEMLDSREDLGNAIALNSTMFNGARLIGPPIAGVVIAWVGETTCFALNAVSYVAVILALLAMRLPRRTAPRTSGRLATGLWEGFRYTFGFKPIRAILLLLGTVSMASAPLMVLMPEFARHTFHGNASTLGMLTGALGAGALLGAVYLASRASVLGLGRVLYLAAIAFGLGTIVFSYVTSLPLGLTLLALVGFAMMVQMASSNTIIQTIVEESFRGRVMAFYSMAFLGMAPLGSLLGGAIAARLGAAATIRFAGCLCIVAGAVFAVNLPAIRVFVRPIYRRAGILPTLDGEALAVQED